MDGWLVGWLVSLTLRFVIIVIGHLGQKKNLARSLEASTNQMALNLKIGTLLLKTLSKPLANSLKRRAQSNQRFERFCVGLAQVYNNVDSRLKQSILDYKSEPIKPLSEARAVELGANFLSELIIFGVGAATIIMETVRTSQNNKKKKILAEERMQLQEQELSMLKSHVSRMNELVTDMESRIQDLLLVSKQEQQSTPKILETMNIIEKESTPKRWHQ